MSEITSKKGNELPEYLYHYTSIESLALIFENRNIRFRPLDKMDDLQEQITSDLDSIGKLTFVSSWTDNSKEDIPMWRMYTPKSNGVRIKLKANPFEYYQINIPEKVSELTKIKNIIVENNTPMYSLVNIEDFWTSNYYITNHNKEQKQLFQICYTDSKFDLEPHLLLDKDKSISLNFGRMGKHKNKYWEFQNEWRYILNIQPLSMREAQKLNPQTYENLMRNYITGNIKLDFDQYFLKIRQECFEEMTITLAPDISESSRVIVSALKEKFNPKCKIEESELLGLLN